MKLRKHLHDKAKRTGNHIDLTECKQARNEVNRLLETAHRNYCTSLLTILLVKKGFGHTLKQKGKIYNTEIVPLKDGENICTDAKHEAHILNKKFQSVHN